MSFLLKYSERTLWEFSVPFNPIKLLGLHFWEKPQGVFVMLVVVALPHLSFFIHFFLTSSLIFSWVITRFTFKGIYPFSPAHCKVICNTFIFTFWAFHFIPSAVFSILHSCRTFSCICDSDNSRISPSMILSMPALIELSLRAGAWFWTTDFIVTSPLFYHVHQWATK